MAWAFLHGKDFVAILPPLMTYVPSLQTAWAGEPYTTHTLMLSHNSISDKTILGYSNTSAVIACSVACMAT